MGMKTALQLTHKEIDFTRKRAAAHLLALADGTRKAPPTAQDIRRGTERAIGQLKRGFVAGAGGKKARRQAMRAIGYRDLAGYGARRGEGKE